MTQEGSPIPTVTQEAQPNVDPVKAWMQGEHYDEPITLPVGETTTEVGVITDYVLNRSDGEYYVSLALDGSERTMTVRELLAAQEAMGQRQSAVEVGHSALSTELDGATPESPAPRSREELLFKPVPTMAEKGEEPAPDFSHLLDVDSELLVDAGAMRETGNIRTQVTEESMQGAIQSLEAARKADHMLDRIISESPLIKGQTLLASEIPDLIRTNPELRLQLGSYLLGKINDPDLLQIMPKRVVDNTQKSTDVEGYNDPEIRRMTSREYAVLLALSHLDGTFNEQNSRSDTETYDFAKEVGTGQHRFAARELLMTRANDGEL